MDRLACKRQVWSALSSGGEQDLHQAVWDVTLNELHSGSCSYRHALLDALDVTAVTDATSTIRLLQRYIQLAQAGSSQAQCFGWRAAELPQPPGRARWHASAQSGLSISSIQPLSAQQSGQPVPGAVLRGCPRHRAQRGVSPGVLPDSFHSGLPDSTHPVFGEQQGPRCRRRAQACRHKSGRAPEAAAWQPPNACPQCTQHVGMTD